MFTLLKQRRLTPLFSFLLISILGFLIYSHILHSPFQFDDHEFIVKNQYIQSFDRLKYFFNKAGLRGRIVTFTTFALNFSFHQFDTFGYHLLNVIIHLINAWLVRWLVLLVLSTRNLVDRYKEREKLMMALFVSLLFLCHPIQTQAVTYISQRFASLATLFYLFSLCLYIKGRLNVSQLVRRNILFVFSGVSAVLGMLSKEIVFTLPAMVVLSEILLFRKQDEKIDFQFWKSKSKIIFILIFVLAVVFIPLLFNLNINAVILDINVSSESHPGDIITAKTYFLTQMRVISLYLRLLVLPIGQNLVYDFPLSQSLLEVKTLVGAVFLLLVFILGVLQRKKDPLLAFGIFWFFITASVESSIIPIRHVIFEHRMYLPSIGFFICICVCFFKFIKNKKLLTIVLMLCVCAFSTATFLRNRVWKSEMSLWQDVAKKSPGLTKPFINLSRLYIGQDNDDEALINIEKAMKNNPYSDKAYNNLGIILHKKKDYAGAIKQYNRGIAISPNNEDIYYNRGLSYYMLGSLDRALEDFAKVIKINQWHSEAFFSRAIIFKDTEMLDSALNEIKKAIKINKFTPKYYVLSAFLQRSEGDMENALKDVEMSISLEPNSAEAYNLRGNIYRDMDRDREALDDFTRAITIDNSFSEAYNNRGIIYKNSGDYDKALKGYSKAIELDSQYALAYNNRGNVWRILQREDLAVKDYSQAISLNPRQGIFFLNRALSLESDGKVLESIKDLQKAKLLGVLQASELIKKFETKILEK